MIYGYKITKDFSTGVNINFFKWESGAVSTSTGLTESLSSKYIISLNTGVLYQISKKINLGIVLKNINTAKISSTDTFRENLLFEAGVGFLYATKRYRFLSDVYFNKNYYKINFGCEYEIISNALLAKTGIETKNMIDGINFSSGIEYKLNISSLSTTISYSFLYPIIGISSSMGTHFASLKVMF